MQRIIRFLPPARLLRTARLLCLPCFLAIGFAPASAQDPALCRINQQFALPIHGSQPSIAVSPVFPDGTIPPSNARVRLFRYDAQPTPTLSVVDEIRLDWTTAPTLTLS